MTSELRELWKGSEVSGTMVVHASLDVNLPRLFSCVTVSFHEICGLVREASTETGCDGEAHDA